MLDKMEKLGKCKSVVGLVIPTGYSFCLDGTSIHLTMAAVFYCPATKQPYGYFPPDYPCWSCCCSPPQSERGVTLGSGLSFWRQRFLRSGILPVAGLALIPRD